MKNIVVTTLIGMFIVAMGTVSANAETFPVVGYDTTFDKCWKDPIHRPFECPPIIYNPR